MQHTPPVCNVPLHAGSSDAAAANGNGAPTRPDGSLPIIISFYGGAEYYHLAGARLREDCDALGLQHDICEVRPAEGENWANICRRKTAFYIEKLRQHRSPVMWVDVDSRILSRPDVVGGSRFDMCGYLQRFRHIRDFNPFEAHRFWCAGVLLFNPTARTIAFLDHLESVDRACTAQVTDDYLLEEAWKTFPQDLSVGLLAPDMVARSPQEVTASTVFLIGYSGSTPEFKGKVAQHVQAVKEPRFQAAVLADQAAECRRGGDKQTAMALARRAGALAPDDPDLIARSAEVLAKCGASDAALNLIETSLKQRPDAPALRLAQARTGLATRDLRLARSAIDHLLSLGGAHANEARSLRYELELDERALARGLGHSDRPALWWMRGPAPGNLGDVLGPYLVERLTGLPPRLGKRGQDMLTVGSIIKFAKPGCLVWGSGSPRAEDKVDPAARYLAVRGPLSRRIVLASGGSCPEIYGDPALLLPRFCRPKTAPARHRLGLIRHIAHTGRAIQTTGVLEIPIAGVGDADVQTFVDAVCSCDAILSTSLHGLIIANAYGVPSRWCSFGPQDDAISGDGTKFHDYFDSVHLPRQQALDLSRFPVIDADLSREVAGLDGFRFDAGPLLAAFPRPSTLSTGRTLRQTMRRIGRAVGFSGSR